MNLLILRRSVLKHMVILIVISLSGSIAMAQEPGDSLDPYLENQPVEDTLSSDLPVFGPDDPMVCTLEFDMKKFYKERYKDQYQDAKLIYHLRDSIDLEKTIRLKARGIFRKDYCSFPPIKINLKKTKDRSGIPGNIEKLKLVTHCKYSELYEQYVLKEYLVYKLYNLLTEYSFQVRLMKLRYIDTGSKKPKLYSGFGFIIEPVDMLAERNNSVELEVVLNQNYFDKTAMTRFALFQFMIGNTDWSFPNKHNVKLLKIMEWQKEAPIPVPYDFDYSGFVNTKYAIPDELFEINSVRVRLFRGMCRTKEEFNEAISEFNDIKDQVYQTILEFEYLDDNTRKEILKYVDEFYRIIESEKLVNRFIISFCKEY